MSWPKRRDVLLWTGGRLTRSIEMLVLMETGRHGAPDKAQLLDKIEENVAQNDQVFNAIENEIRRAAPGAVEHAPVVVAS